MWRGLLKTVEDDAVFRMSRLGCSVLDRCCPARAAHGLPCDALCGIPVTSLRVDAGGMETAGPSLAAMGIPELPKVITGSGALPGV